jgi:hypothetical protein
VRARSNDSEDLWQADDTARLRRLTGRPASRPSAPQAGRLGGFATAVGLRKALSVVFRTFPLAAYGRPALCRDRRKIDGFS